MRRGSIALVAGWVLLAGCTATSQPGPATSSMSTPTISVSSSPTSAAPAAPTLDKNQAAAVRAVQAYSAVAFEIRLDQSKFTKKQLEAKLGEWAAENVVEANVNAYLLDGKKGSGVLGEVKLLELTTSKTRKPTWGLEVKVTVCRDQTQLKVVDEKGQVVADEQERYPTFLKLKYVVRKLDGTDTWKVHGWTVQARECGVQ